LAFFNVSILSESIINNLNIAIQTFISVVLIIRFNPLRKVNMTENDREIIFGTAVFLFGNLAITQYLLNYIKINYLPTTIATTVNKK